MRYDRCEEVGGACLITYTKLTGRSSVTGGQQKIFNGEMLQTALMHAIDDLLQLKSPWVMSIIDSLAMRIGRSNQSCKNPLSVCYTIKAPLGTCMTRLPRAYVCIDRSGLGGAGGRTPSLSILGLASLATVVLVLDRNSATFQSHP